MIRRFAPIVLCVCLVLKWQTVLAGDAAPVGSTVSQTAAEPVSPAPSLKAGVKGSVTLAALFQGWFYFNHTKGTNASTFRLRRMEIALKGEIIPKQVAFGLMIDPSRAVEYGSKRITLPEGESVLVSTPPAESSALTILQDFMITFKNPKADVSLGQFKIPLSLEALQPSSAVLFPERALIARTFGDKRDIGVRVAKTFHQWAYTAGLFNGAGQNRSDSNNAKDLALRAEAYPVKGLTLAGAVYESILDDPNTPTNKERFEASLRFETGRVVTQGEFLSGHDVRDNGSKLRRQGFYGTVAAFLQPRLQIAARAGMLDNNMDGKDQTTHLEGGLNAFLVPNQAKLQLAYAHLRQTSPNKDDSNEVTLNAQVWF